MARISKHEVKKRVNYTEELLASAISPSRIVEILIEKYGIKERMAWYYIAKVTKRWDEEREKVAPNRKAQLRASLEQLYRQCLASGDKKTAATVLDKMIKMDGCYPSEKSEVNHQVSLGINLDSRVMNEETIRERLKKLREGNE